MWDRKAYVKKYAQENKEKIRESKRKYLRKLRIEVVELMGNKCVECGFRDTRALQIDHINGQGSKERKEVSSSSRIFLQRVKYSFLNKEEKYQILCANCNWIKRFKKNEHKYE